MAGKRPSKVTGASCQPLRAKILRGPVHVTYRADLIHPSWHLDPSCAGLEKYPDPSRAGLEKVESERCGLREFPDAWALAADTDGRICSMCTLESLLCTILRTRSAEPSCYVTFSSMPPATSRCASRTTHATCDWLCCYRTPSAEASLRRIAQTLGLETTSTSFSGVVAYGTVPARAVDALGVNLDTLTIPWVRRTPLREEIQCFWVLAADHDRPLATALRRELWKISRLLLG